MRLQEKHKEFVVRGYACFMARTEIVDAFMEEFNDEIYQLCTDDTPSEEKYSTTIDKHLKKYGIPATAAEVTERELVHANEPFNSFGFKRELRAARNNAKEKLSARFRRLNITHPQFPEKYRALFHQTREEYLANYRTAPLSIPENVILELETLYKLTKELAFEKRDLKSITQATQILKTIAACNALNEQPNIQDVTPQDVKALQDTEKNLTHQLKKETRQLAKHAAPSNS